MDPSDIVRLRPLRQRTDGVPDVTVGMVDGPALLDHPAFPYQRIRQIRSEMPNL